MTYSYFQGHRPMIFDDHRNSLYESAIRKLVTPDSVVLDLGAGLGQLGLIAARAGAKQVYLAEPSLEPELIRQIVTQNADAERVKIIHSKIEETRLPAPVDLIISVFTGNFLLEEDLIPSLFYARDHYLKESGCMIPDCSTMEIAAVTVPDTFSKYISTWSDPSQDIHFESLRKYAANTIYYEKYNDHEALYLSEPAQLLHMNFHTAKKAECNETVTLEMNRAGLCHGIIGWFTARIGKEWLSTAPHAPGTHWSQAWLPLDPPLEVKPGELMEFHLQRHEFGEWSWSVRLDQSEQKHSTFLSGPLSTRSVQRKSENYKASLDEKGRAALYVLQKFNGEVPTITIARDIAATWPELFPDVDYARQFVTRLIERYCSD